MKKSTNKFLTQSTFHDSRMVQRETLNSTLFIHSFVLLFLIMFCYTSSLQAQAFDSSNLDFGGFAGVDNATSLEFGPDGNLYVAEEDGLVKIYTIQRNGIKDYDVTAAEVLTLVQSIPNHDDDDGSLGGPSNRQVTGITVTGTAIAPVVYVSSSDRRRGAGGGGGDANLDTNSGVITRLTKNGSGVWEAVDIVRGLPRSEENHATNGLQFVTIGSNDWLVVSSGGFTNAGSPSNNFAYITEYALSGAVLALDLTALEALPILNDGSRNYIYDIPTLDDPTRANVGPEDPDAPGYTGVDINDPWGGNDGLNMGMLVAGSPVKMFSPGYRNSYDNIITEDGHVYVTDNGANGGWGGFPEFEGDPNSVNNNYRSGEPGSTGPDGAPNSTPFDPQVNNSDHLNLVSTNINSYVFGSVYGGHPCPVRANVNAGLFTRGTHSAGGTGQTFSDSYFRTQVYDPDGSTPNSETDPQKALPANWPPVDPSLINVENADFRQPTLNPGVNPEGTDDIIVVNWSNNTNAIAEYTASNFGGVMQGDLVAGKGNALHRVDRDGSGNIVGFEESKFTGITGNALGVDCQGDAEIFPGTIWVANYNGDDIVILEPNDFVICILPGETGYDPNGDNDSDGYTNDDEDQNGTDMCSGASQPTDFDNDLVSDLLDLDDDADGINDNLDPLQMGSSVDLPVENELFLGTNLGGYLGLGFTGLMNNGDANPNYLNWQDDPFASNSDVDDILGGAIGAVTMYQTSGDATTNDQEKAYQYGINVDNTTNGFTIHGRMFPPFHNFSATESQGMFIGDGFQDNYVKIVLGQNYELSIVGENNGTQVTYIPSTDIGFVPNTSTNNFDVFLDVDPSTGNVQAKYQIDNGSINNLGSSFTLQGGTLTSLQSTTEPLMVGIIGTADTNDGFAANWDFLNVIGSVPFVSQQLTDIDRLINDPSEVIGLDSYFGDDNGTGNLTFSVEDNTDTAIGASISGNNLTLTFPSTSASSTITIRATDGDNFFVEQSFVVNVSEAPTAIYRINANGPVFTDSNGENWEADNYFVGGSTYANAGQAIGNTTDDDLYVEERYGNFSYEFPVSNGDYTVELHFAEIYFGLPSGGSGGVGSRIFNVNIEGGAEELTDYDIVADVGSGNAVIKSFPATVTDGTLNVVFTNVTNNAKISAIAVLSGQINGSPISVDAIANQTDNLGETPVLGVVASGGNSNETFDFQATGLPPGLTIENTNGSILGTISSNPNDAGIYPVSVTVSKPSSTPVTISFNWNVLDPNAVGTVLYRINTGGALTASNDSSPVAWEEDQKDAAAGAPGGNAVNGTPSQYVNFAAQDFTFGAALPGTFVNTTGYPDALFATERYNTQAVPNNMQWSFPTGNGDFQVNLLFNENWNGENNNPANHRIFDVEIENLMVLDDYRPSVDGTQINIAKVESFQVNVSDGTLNIDFIQNNENPAIKGIEIISIAPPVNDQWVAQTDDENHTARHECSFVQVGEKFYLFGGRENPANLDVYDYQTKTWSTITASAPSDFNHFQAVEHDGMIWVIGAFKDNAFPNEVPADFVWVYNPVTDDWIQGPAIPAGRKRGSSGLVVYNNKFYIIAGNTDGHDGGYIPWFDEFDPSTGIWTSLTDAPRARDHFHAGVIGNKLYVAGGRLSGGTGGTFNPLIAEVDVYDFSNGTWSTLPSGQNIPTPRAAASVGVLDGELYVIGGEIEDDLQGNTINDAVKTTESFDPSTGNWTSRADLITERHGTQAIVSGNGIHVTAGSNTKGGSGTMKNMEFYGNDNPAGTAQVAGQVTVPASFIVPTGGNGPIALTHSSGNVGVIVTNMQFSGQDASEFSILNNTGFYFIGPGQTNDISIAHSGTENDKTATLTITYDDGSTAAIPLVSEGAEPTVLYRINAGGAIVTDAHGDFEEDQSAATANGSANTGTPSTYINVTPPAFDKTYGATTPLVENNTGYPDVVFQTERYSDAANPDNMQWSFPTGVGNFEVNLLFNENWGNENANANNHRIFDVEIEGVLVLDDYRPSGDGTDVNIAKVESFPVTVSGDGILNIDFLKGNQNPAIKGIEILSVVANMGDGPVVTNPGAQVGVEGDLVNLPITAIDGTTPSCGPLTYSATNLPANVTIDENTGVISGTLLAGTGSGTDGAFIEDNGIVVIEMESTDNLPGSWVDAANATSPNISNPGNATGGDFIIWEGGQSLNSQGNSTISYPVEITTTGTYQFKWRTQVGNGTSSTDHNDTWLKIEGDAFYGQKGGNGTIVCPKGYNSGSNDCTGNVPQGGGGNGWFKVYSSGSTNWTWSTLTSDNDGHQIYARFDTPGTYNILISVRSSSHALDRMVLAHSGYSGNEQSLSLAESERSVGQTPGASADSPYDVVVTVTDACTPQVSTDVAFTWNVTATPIGNPAAEIIVNGGDTLTASTYGNNSYLLSNTGDDDIVNVTINTTTGFMRDVVFDPVGTAGDSVAKCLTAGGNGSTAAQVGLTVPANGGSQEDDCVSIFTQFHNGIDNQEGHDIMSLDFTDFNPGEDFYFGIDMDPTTIKGDVTSGDAGSISGFELIGTTISVEFASGVVYTTSLFDEGSLGGSDAIIDIVSNALLAPSISVDGTDASRLVTDANQIVQVTGPPNASVTLLRVDGRLHLDSGNPSEGYDIDPFEANEALAKQLYTISLDGSGVANIPVVLTQTAGATNTPDGGLNHFIAVVNGPNNENSIASNAIVLEYDPNAIIGPAVLVEITPDADLDTSTYGSGSLQISNNSTGALQITNVTIDLSTAILPDMVFDPVGTGGDATAKCFEANTGATEVGLVAPADPCVSPFSQPRDGGYDVMSIDFTQFDPGETFTFATDIDPNSIKGVAGAGAAGAVSGLELIGATITITFNDNSTLITSLYDDGSFGGGQAIAALQAPVTPSISVSGAGIGPATVNNLSQTVVVTGTPGDVVSLMVMDSRLFIASGDPPNNVPDPTYYANESMDKTLYTATIGAGGTVDIPITMLQTQFGNGTPDGGLNQIVAVSSSGSYVTDKQVSNTSNVVTLLYDPNAVDTGDLTLSYTMQGRTDLTADLTVDVYAQGASVPSYQFTPTGTSGGEVTVTGLDVGTYEVTVKVSNFLQRVLTITVAAGANSASVPELRAGDANNDNFVTLQDFSILAGTFNLQSGDAAYDPRADFNGDGFVTLVDFSLQASNFNTQGEVIP